MSQSPTDDTTVVEPTEGTWTRANWLVISLFTLLSLVGIVLSTGVLKLGVVDTSGTTSGVAVPTYIYLYASLGALGYIFTKLMAGIESFDDAADIDRLVELALRIPVAWILGAGTYLLATVLLPESVPNTDRFTVGVAFLVGLYVNVIMKSLGSLADRLLGRGRES